MELTKEAMDKYDIQKLRDLPIESVAERLGLKVTKHKSLCPFHEDSHPSLSFKNNGYRCFVCGEHGGVIDLAMHVLGKSFIDTCNWLANEHNVILTEWKPTPTKTITITKTFDATRFERFFERPYLNDSATKFLFDERKLDPRVIRWCRLTSWKDRNGISWLQIPYYDENWMLTGVQWRNLNYSPPKQGEQGGHPRFKFPQGSQCHIYNRPVLKLLKPNEPLFIAEGCSDCWSILSSGHKCIAIPSATLLKPEDLEPLRGRELHIYPDNDEAGERLYQQLVGVATSIGSCLVRHALPSGCKDFSDYFKTKYNN